MLAQSDAKLVKHFTVELLYIWTMEEVIPWGRDYSDE